jgi:hypothetical protein
VKEVINSQENVLGFISAHLDGNSLIIDKVGLIL